jgi:hypothetical protein
MRRIERSEQLPPPGAPSAATREAGDLDFKKFADSRAGFEHAKDVAAFANALGGVLLVGAAEDATGAVEYPGLRGQEAKDVQTIYERAAGLCTPAPTVDPVAIHLEGGRIVVAVNVTASVDAVIAVPATFRNREGARIQVEGWSYPRRVGSQTSFITPSELPMFMTTGSRRGFLLVHQVPDAHRKNVVVFYGKPRVRAHAGLEVEYVERELELRGASISANTVEFAYTHGQSTFRVPIMDVLDVWEHVPGRWSIRLAGIIDERDLGSQFGRQLVYRPIWR